MSGRHLTQMIVIKFGCDEVFKRCHSAEMVTASLRFKDEHSIFSKIRALFPVKSKRA